MFLDYIMDALCKPEASSFSGLYDIYRQVFYDWVRSTKLHSGICGSVKWVYKNDMSLNKRSESQKFSEWVTSNTSVKIK